MQFRASKLEMCVYAFILCVCMYACRHMKIIGRHAEVISTPSVPRNEFGSPSWAAIALTNQVVLPAHCSYFLKLNSTKQQFLRYQ